MARDALLGDILLQAKATLCCRRIAAELPLMKDSGKLGRTKTKASIKT